MNRWKAFAIHLGISALIGTVVISTMLLVWYPGPFFTVDRFDLVAANDIKPAELARVADPRFQSIPWGRPPTIAVKSPTDPKEQMRIIQSALEGSDLQTFPQYYVDYEAFARQAIKASKPYAVLRRRHPEPGSLALVDKRLAELGKREEEVRFLPLKARKTDYCVLLDARSGAVLGFLALYPW